MLPSGAVIDHVNSQLAPLDKDLRAFARAQPGCRALMGHYGIGPQVACAILAELGDTRRFSSSRQVVRFAGLDITVHESDGKRRAGHLSRQRQTDAHRATPRRIDPQLPPRRLSSAVALNVDLDTTLTVWAAATYDALRHKLPGYEGATPDTIWRRFISTSGQITIGPDHVTCRLNSRTYSPVMRTASLPNTDIPWWNGRHLRLEFA